MKKSSPIADKLMNLTLEVMIEHIGSRGEGIAHWQDQQIFVPKTAPGDEVRIEIIAEKKGRYQARLIELLQAGPTRVSPQCSHFQLCGGCDWQHLDYPQQLELKRQRVQHWVKRSPLAVFVDDCHFDEIQAPAPYAYRHRVQIESREGGIGFKRARSHEVEIIKECPVLTPGFFEAIEKKLDGNQSPGLHRFSFAESHLVEDSSFYSLDGLRLHFDSQCFTQANLEVNSLMWSRIKEDVEKISDRSLALDLYCGIGNFSLPLAKHFDLVRGVEENEHSIRWANFNSKENHLQDKLRFHHENCADFLVRNHSQEASSNASLVLVDPPRSGLGATLKALMTLAPDHLVYISCQPDTLIKDLTALTKKAGYRMTRWTIVDLLPQTKHIESIVSLRKT